MNQQESESQNQTVPDYQPVCGAKGICLFCNKEFEQRTAKSGRGRVFCSDRCKGAYNYRKRRANPEYMQKLRDYSKRYRLKKKADAAGHETASAPAPADAPTVTPEETGERVSTDPIN